MEFLVVQLPRGRTAVVQFDPATGCVTTDHAGILRTLFQKGVTDWSGCKRFPADGRAFLAAVYDHLFLRRYPVGWLGLGSDSFSEPRME